MASGAAEALRVMLLPSTSAEDRKRANRILNDFQRTPEAWTLADELLRAEQPDPAWTHYCRMFAAQVCPRMTDELYRSRCLTRLHARSLLDSDDAREIAARLQAAASRHASEACGSTRRSSEEPPCFSPSFGNATLLGNSVSSGEPLRYAPCLFLQILLFTDAPPPLVGYCGIVLSTCFNFITPRFHFPHTPP